MDDMIYYLLNLIGATIHFDFLVFKYNKGFLL